MHSKYDKSFYKFLNGHKGYINNKPYKIKYLKGLNIVDIGKNFWPPEYWKNKKKLARWKYMQKVIEYCKENNLLSDFFHYYFIKNIEPFNSKKAQEMFLNDLNKKLKFYEEKLVIQNKKIKIIKIDSKVGDTPIDLDESNLEDIFDSGGMCNILFTSDPKILKKQLVHKNLNKEKQERFKQRFLNEYEIMTLLKNENFVLLVYDLDRENFSYKMPKCEKFKDKILSMLDEEKIYYIICVLNATKYIFSKKIFHRDIKPSNTLFYKGRWILSDFGIAKNLENTMNTQSVWGTRNYMHPGLNDQDNNNFKNFKHEYDLYSIKRIIEIDILKTISSKKLIEKINILLNEWPKKLEELPNTIKKLKEIYVDILF